MTLTSNSLDVLINATKIKTLLPQLLHDKTLVVLIQNGIGVEEDVQKMFPDV